MKLLPAPKQPIALLPPGPARDDPGKAGMDIPPSLASVMPPAFEMSFNSPGGGRATGPAIFTTNALEQKLYKLATLTHFDGAIWGTHETNGYPSLAASAIPLHRVPWLGESFNRTEELIVSIENFDSEKFPTPGFGKLKFFPSSKLIVDGSIELGYRTQRQAYAIEYNQHVPDPEVLRKLPLSPPDQSIPASERMLNLAKQFAAAFDNPWDLTNAIMAHTLAECKYDKDAPSTDGNPIEDFLFDTKRGICQHFAGAAAALLILAGQKARIVLGYASSKKDPKKITANGAHAWIEVHFPDLGWIEFDPTNNADALDEDQGEDDESEKEEGSAGVLVVSDEVPDNDELSPEEIEKLEILIEEQLEEEPKIDNPLPFFENVSDIDGWARALGRDLTRELKARAWPRYRGSFEAGQRLNSSQLYRATTGDTRLYSRRKVVADDPAEVIVAYDESPSVRRFPAPHREVWNRARYMISEGLNYAHQDFAIIGFRADTHWYKKLREDYSDEVKQALIDVANKRISTGGGTATHRVIEKMRREHRNHRSRFRHGIILTDGDPNLEPLGMTPQQAVREQVELAKGEGLHITGVILENPIYPVEIEKLDEMFHRLLILSPKRDEADEQLRTLLVKMICQK